MNNHGFKQVNSQFSWTWGLFLELLALLNTARVNKVQVMGVAVHPPYIP